MLARCPSPGFAFLKRFALLSHCFASLSRKFASPLRRFRAAFALRSLCVRCAFALRSLCVRCAFWLQRFHCFRTAFAPLPCLVRSHCAWAALGLRSRCVRAAFALRSRCVRAAFALRSRCVNTESALRLFALRLHCVCAVFVRAAFVSVRYLSNMFAIVRNIFESDPHTPPHAFQTPQNEAVKNERD
jgi:hypothetical protein